MEARSRCRLVNNDANELDQHIIRIHLWPRVPQNKSIEELKRSLISAFSLNEPKQKQQNRLKDLKPRPTDRLQT